MSADGGRSGRRQLATADLSDAHGDQVQLAEPGMRHFGGREAFHGRAVTVRAVEDNSLVRELLSEPGAGRVLVVDGAGSGRCALLGDGLAALALEHGWSGVVVWGCVRDAARLASMDIGCLARGTHPRRSVKAGVGERNVSVAFLGVRIVPGDAVVADADGLLVGPAAILDPASAP